uniref:glucan endo-1,3-beta-D-glucosidase n=1 Tax=Populus alba TaxID=43335 RepID=A0A4U5QPM5_POPAL|nr:hypothetical protein D5086_0000074590 [Populus alba]
MEWDLRVAGLREKEQREERKGLVFGCSGRLLWEGNAGGGCSRWLRGGDWGQFGEGMKVGCGWLREKKTKFAIIHGQVADNLPPPPSTAKLLQSTSIQKVRLYGSDPAIIKALANTGIGIVIGTANGEIPGLASDPNFSKSWINTNALPFYPASNIILITVGNEVMTSNDQNLMNKLLPAMQNVQNALNDASLGGKIKVSTVHLMGVLKRSEPPSSGSFDPCYGDLMKGLLEFNSANGSPFAINPYPYFA